MCAGYKMAVKNIGNISIFKFLFTAAESKQLVLLSLSEKSSLLNLLFYNRLWLTHKYEMKTVNIKKATGYFVCETKVKKMSFSFGNCFLDQDGVFMSSMYLSDFDNSNTHISFGGSEGQCVKVYQTHPDQTNDTTSCPCFPLFYQSISGHCSMYNTQIFHRANSNISLLNNSNKTGIYENTKRQFAVTKIPMNNTIIFDKESTCNAKYLLPCDNNDMACFDILDICVYRLDILHNLFPCWSGSHIKQCEHFECNQYFKCPAYYCIPWSYVCDGKWDCPYGYDESGIHDCRLNRTCKHMFKCWYSQLCIHMFDVCNRFEDCPNKDDEAMCELRDVNCPKSCMCLNFAVMCTAVPRNERFFFNSPFVSYHFVLININSIKFLEKSKFLAVLNVSQNSISSVCDSVGQLYYLKSIDISWNSITQILSRCFSGFEKLYVIRISSNKLIHISQESFYNLDQITSVDLSNNELNIILRNIFYNVTRILNLNLCGNPLTNIDSNIFAKLHVSIVITDSFQICCFAPEETFCPADKPWYSSCSALLPNLSVKLTSVITSLFILTLNLLSIFINIITFKKNRYGELCGTIVLFINSVDILCGIYLLVIWAVDFYYGQNFILHYFQWNTKFLCQISFFVHFCFSLLNPYLLCILSLARLMVIKYPPQSRFKSPSFVLKCILYGNTTLFALCISIFISKQTIPTSLCSPFIHPSDTRIQINNISMFVAIIQFAAFLFICVVNYSMVKALLYKDHFTPIRPNNLEKNIVLQLVFLTSSNLLSWFPSSIIFLSSWFLIKHPTKLLVWTIVAVMPTNCIVNPFVFLIFNTRIKFLCRRKTNTSNTLKLDSN